MAIHRSPATSGNREANFDSDRIARFGHVRREPTVCGGLARRLNLARVRRPGGACGRRGSCGAGTTVFASSSLRSQRVVIKVLSRRHWQSKGSGLRKHVNYLARASASRDGRPGVFYSAERDVLSAADAGVAIRQWEEDRHHVRIIISAEKSDHIHDLGGYVRDVVRRIENDLNTELQWIAIDHHNTDNAHSHVLVRGIDERGQVLAIRSDYIAHGMRQRAVEAATDLVGERTQQEVRTAKLAEVHAERFTSLDRVIERGLDANCFDAARSAHVGFAREDRDLVVGRLQFLEALGLASKDRRTIWHLATDFRRRLTELGARNDIIRQLYSSLGARAGQARPVNQRSLAHKPLVGVLLTKGAIDEISDLQFVAVRDRAGDVHYARVRDSRSFRATRVGEHVELGRAAYEQRRTAEAVMAVATANGGVYRAAEHAKQVRARQPSWTEGAILVCVEAHVQRLGRWAEQEASGVKRIADGEYRVDARRFDRYVKRIDDRSTTDVRPSAAHGRSSTLSRGSSGQEVDR